MGGILHVRFPSSFHNHILFTLESFPCRGTVIYLMTIIIYLPTLLQVANIVATFTWNFVDLFIIIMSSAIAVRFKQISERIKAAKVNG